LEVHYHPGKANVVADALSHKAHCSCLSVEAFNETLCWKMRKLNLEIIPQGDLNHLSVEAKLRDSIVLAQQRNKGVRIIKQKIKQGEGKYKCFRVESSLFPLYRTPPPLAGLVRRPAASAPPWSEPRAASPLAPPLTGPALASPRFATPSAACP
jgi:hypothetical protein